MKPAPPDWPRLSGTVFADDAKAEIAWLTKAFGFEPRLIVEGDDGSIVHSELVFGEAVICVGQTGRRPWYKSPRSAGGNTAALFMYIDDVDAHCARAEAAGAEITDRPEVHDYGDDYWADRSYGCVDPEGHHWWFSERMKTKGK
jgi:uncharacterized glyoxalase superfamily protein PhnB